MWLAAPNDIAVPAIRATLVLAAIVPGVNGRSLNRRGIGWGRTAQDATEGAAPRLVRTQHASSRAPTDRPRLVLAPSLLSVLFATAVAWGMLIYLASPDLCSVGTVYRGANINHAVRLVCVGGLAELGLLLFAGTRRRVLAPVLLAGAVMLAVSLGLVALDSSTAVVGLTGYFLGPCGGTWTRHLGYLYYLWGAPLIVLLLQAARVWAHRRRQSPAFPETDSRA